MIIGQVELLTKLVENGIIAAAFLYILYWLLNKQSREMAESSKHARITNIEIARSIRGLINVVMGMQQQLLSHDLTVTGINPESGGDCESRQSLAFKKYNEVMTALEEQKSLIRQMNEAADIRINNIRSNA